ncbi:unnamed protein product [Rotaria magnacalcarata]|uniref:Amino acid transporter transmembrane domain-containing protein n=1 Tax=Rotaria magnacalcarata TaxID=392030 RepID=A0A816QKZ4_9BILA|nr:unnamed protein product [Rotaria magnacalcarata]
MYTFEGIALVLPVRQKMREPEAYGGCNGVLNTGIYLVTILYFFVVFFFGYIRCDSDARGSISLNLPVDNKLYQFTNIMYAVAIFLTYNLQFYVPFTLLWPLTIAALIPNLGLVISLVGAVASTALSVIFPPICETITFWPNKLGRFKWQLILNLLIIIFGVYVFIAGTTLSISNIVACIREGAGCDD